MVFSGQCTSDGLILGTRVSDNKYVTNISNETISNAEISYLLV